MQIGSCRDCSNLEDRRNIDNVALCAMHHGPSVSCQEFKPKSVEVDPDQLYGRFCINCANFENVEGIPVCAKGHRPGIAWRAFKSKQSVRRRKSSFSYSETPMFLSSSLGGQCVTAFLFSRKFSIEE